MAFEELDLGLEPAKPKRTRVARDRTDYEWAAYKVINRRFCDICLAETPKIKGVPKHAINKAMFIERGPEGTKWLCNPHQADRELALAPPKKKEKKDGK